MKDLFVIGSGGHARQVVATAKVLRLWHQIIIIDLNKEDLGESILGQPVRYGIDNLNHLVPDSVDLFFAFGDNNQRADLYHKFVTQGFNCPSLIHPSAFVDESVSIGPSNYIGSQVNISGDCSIGVCNIVNNLVNIDHETQIGNFNHFSPGSIICGRAKIANFVWLGANATVIDNIFIEDKCFVGAGSVIIKDIVDVGSTLVGVPGRQI